MSPKKKRKAASAEKELKAAVKKLRSQLAVAEKSAEKWKSRAKSRGKDVADLKSERTGLRRRLSKAESNVAKWKDRAKSRPTPALVSSTPDPVAESIETAADPPATVPAEPLPMSATAPDKSWNVTRLRAEARVRGVAGYSRKTKEQLLVELRDADVAEAPAPN